MGAAVTMALLASCESPPPPEVAPAVEKVESAVGPAPLTDIHSYADECMCQMGGRSGVRMPQNLTELVGKKIPMYWNQKEIGWGTPTLGGAKQWIFKDAGAWKAGAANFPEAGANGPFLALGDAAGGAPKVKCDRWPTVDTSCSPDQRAYQVDVNGVTWTVIMRRTQPINPGAAFGPNHAQYFEIVDVQAFKADTGAACWFDTVKKGSFTNAALGFPVGPMPRPGGRSVRSANYKRATDLWDTVAQMKAGDCTACHGNGPLIGSDFIAQATGYAYNNDDLKPYWNAAGLLPDRIFFTGATDLKTMKDLTCSSTGCHERWATNASTTPNGNIATHMTSVLPAGGPTSAYRMQSAVNPVGNRDASITHAMPSGYAGTVTQWNNDWSATLAAMNTCRAATPGNTVFGNIRCNGVEQAKPVNFYGEQEAVAPAPNQKILAPDQALNLKVTRLLCPGAPPPAQPWLNQCYKVEWDDPADEWNSPPTDGWFLESATAAANGPKPPATAAYCPANAQPATTKTYLTPNPTEWRYHYVTGAVPIAPCTKLAVRICGGWCSHLSKGTGTTATLEIEGCPPPDMSLPPDLSTTDMTSSDLIVSDLMDAGSDGPLSQDLSSPDADMGGGPGDLSLVAVDAACVVVGSSLKGVICQVIE